MTAYASLEEALTVGHGIEREFVCPEGHSTNAHASVNSLTGWWFCFSCHAKGHVDMSRVEMDPYALRRNAEIVQEKLASVTRVYSDSWLAQYDATGPGDYWLGRYSEPACRLHRLGHAPDGSYATIPVRTPQGALLGVIRRDLTGFDKAKYRYPGGLNMSELLYNYENCAGDTIMLVEGATDVVAATEVSYMNAMAVYGSRLSKAQQKLLHQYQPERILVAFDQDEAGEAGYRQIRDTMGYSYPVQRLWWEGYKDLSAIPAEERSEMLHSFRPKRLKIVS